VNEQVPTPVAVALTRTCVSPENEPATETHSDVRPVTVANVSRVVADVKPELSSVSTVTYS
jgi:hypothetical protein